MTPSRTVLDGQPLCAETDPELFFPEKGEQALPGRTICGRCPLRQPCLQLALDLGPDVRGIWGGTTERQRRRLHQVAAA